MNKNENSVWERSKQVARSLFKLQKKEDGASAIEFVLGSLIFVLLLATFLDVLVLSWKFTIISQSATTVARITGLQGGALASAPEGFPSSDYMTSSRLKNHIGGIYKNAGVHESDWDIKVNGTSLGGQIKIDYREPVIVKTHVKYRWFFLSALMPGDWKSDINTTRLSISEFKYRYDEWEGE